MKPLYALLSILIVLILAGSPSSARAQGAEIAGAVASLTVGQVIDEARQAINDVLLTGEGVLDRQSFELFSHLGLLLEAFEDIPRDLLDRTISGVDTQQRLLFTQIYQQTQELNRSVDNIGGNAGRLLGSVDMTLSRIPFISKRPFVTGYSPPYLLINPVGIEVQVDVLGSLLGAGNPSLTFAADLNCRRTGKTESRLTFMCPTAAFAAIAEDEQAKTSTRNAVLRVMRDRTLLETLTLRKAKRYHYDLAFVTVPQLLGTYEAEISGSTERTETASRSRSFPHRNPHCTKKTEPAHDVTATRGWRIDPNSIRVSVDHASQKASFNGVHNPTASGFQLRGVVENEGSCGPFGIKDARGVLNLSVRYNETRPATSPTRKTVSGVLYWGRDEVIPLDATSTAFTLTLRRFDGQVSVVRDTDRSNRWVTVEHTPRQSIIIRPNGMEEALR
jgi:hypothetical protein